MEYNKVILTIAYKNKKVPAWDFLMKINFLYFPYLPCLMWFNWAESVHCLRYRSAVL